MVARGGRDDDEDRITRNEWFEKHVPATLADYLVKVAVKTQDGQVIDHDCRPDLAVVYEELEHQLEEHPSIFAYWSMIFAEQKYAVGEYERQLLFLRAKICEAARNAAKNEGVRYAKHDLDDVVVKNKDYRELEKRHAQAELVLSKLFGILEALRMKSENLRSLAGFKKQELRDTQGQ